MKLASLIACHILLFPASTIAQGKAVHEEDFIPIGGIEQWVAIKGSDSDKPVILFLHGGPGSVMSPYYHPFTDDWEKEFILVHWDQRGAGRTFGHNAPAEVNEDYWIENPLTIGQMTADGIALSEYLIKHLGKRKIIIIGTSWGSVLGAKMALQRPDLFHGYIGHSQVVNASESLANSFNEVFRMAKRADDEDAVNKLGSIGPPPYDDARNAGQLFRIIKKYESANSMPAPDSWWKLAPAYDNETDNKHRYDGDDYSFIHYVGHKKLGITAMMSDIDFMADNLEYKIPVYLIQGAHDILTPQEITKKYFDKLTAPTKKFFLLPEAAHGYNQAVVDTQFRIVKECIAPLVKD